jgi:hypothetical protein
MKYKLNLAVLTLMLLALRGETMQAQGKFGVGFGFGEPTGISWKYRINQTNSIDGLVGISPVDHLRVNVDYLWHDNPFQEQRLLLHYGIGGTFAFGMTQYVQRDGQVLFLRYYDNTQFGVRLPLGLSYYIPKSPVEAFLELAPVLVIAPLSGFGLDGGIGARFYF